MKTLIEIKTEIMLILDTKWHTKREKSALIKKKEFLQKAFNYLETEPDAVFVKSELQKARKQLNLLQSRKPLFDLNNPVDKLESKKWDQNNGVNDKKQQIKFLNFIINDTTNVENNVDNL